MTRGLVPAEVWTRVSEAALALFERGSQVAAGAGFVLADTKYEFGLGPDGGVLLIDEVHTPDSSRYWAADSVEGRLARGEGPEAFDKEPFRLALAATGYRGEGEPPSLSAEVRSETSARYVALYERLTGLRFEPAPQPAAERIRAAVRSAGSPARKEAS